MQKSTEANKLQLAKIIVTIRINNVRQEQQRGIKLVKKSKKLSKIQILKKPTNKPKKKMWYIKW
jgi:hypothetical protein